MPRKKKLLRLTKVVRAHDFISGLKDGYYTEVKERGKDSFQLVSDN